MLCTAPHWLLNEPGMQALPASITGNWSQLLGMATGVKSRLRRKA
jgi:hypothetical protein